MPAKWNPFTTEEWEEMERCWNRVCLTVLLAAAVVQQPEVWFDAKFKE